MNYIELINNFWVSNKLHNFNSLETSLYFFILDYANNARWPENFILPNAVVQSVFRCTKDQLIRARKKLCKSGLVAYETGERHNPGKYTIIAHLKPTQDLPDTCSRPAQELPTPDLSEASFDKQQNSVEREPDLLKTYPTPTQDLPEAFPMPASNINKTKLNKTKQENILSPDGETKTLFSNPRRGEEENSEERAYRNSDTGSIVSSSGVTQKIQGSSHLVSSSLSNEVEDTPQNCRSSLPEPSEVVSPKALEPCESAYLETEDGLVASSSSLPIELSRYEEEIIGFWETVIGPFDPAWISSLRSLLKKCYPSQVKNAIFSLSRTKFEVMKDVGFSYVEQPLLNGMFGKRGNNDGRKNRQCAGKFESDIEKFKNPARAKPKTREELLKYTQY